ncbi:MAG: UDP-N-acetylmuramoyl-L-alanine--D-glutamate ligase [Pseudomonadota bacterium]
MTGAIDLSFLKGKRVLVLGLSRTGLSVASQIEAAGGHAMGWDDGETAREAAIAAGLTVQDPASQLSDIDFVVLSPGIPRSFPAPHPLVVEAEAAGTPIIGDMDLLAQGNPGAQTIGITGTNGKSTTTALIGHLLSEAGIETAVGGNIGQAALTLPALSEAGWYVLELSSFQLETLSLATWDVAILLNISPDHEDRYPDMQAYVDAKTRLLDRPRGFSAAVIGADDNWARELLDRYTRLGRHRVIPISAERPIEGGVAYLADRIVDQMDPEGEKILPIGDLPTLPGAHNRQNAAAAHVALRLAGVSHEDIAAGMATFPGLAHRQQTVATLDGIRFVNDSKATNPEAAVRALTSYDTVYWIAGGKAKGDDYSALEPGLAHVERAFLIGEAADAMEAAFKGKVRLTKSATLDRAIQQAFADARAATNQKSVILLSPACASFDQFENFEKRGERFAELATMLAQAEDQRRASGGST